MSPHTVEAYRRDLASLLKYLETEPGPAPRWEELGAGHLRGFVAWSHRQGRSGRSIQRALSAVRGFCAWLVREGELRASPVGGVRAPKSPRRLPRVLDPDRLGALLDREALDPLELRDLAMLELAYSCGLRLAEMVSLDLVDLDLVERLVGVTGKGRKRRVVPVGRQACAVLERWLEVRGGLAAGSQTALFVGRGGRRLGPRAVQARFRRWSLRSGSGAELHPHLLRHCFASHLLESSGDLRAVQELLGHASIRSTQVYTHLDFQHLARVYDAAHPRARKRRGTSEA